MRKFIFILTFTLIVFSEKAVKAQAYYLGNTGGTSGWHKLGTLHLGQQGKDAQLKILAGGGYNALYTQLGECDIHFRTSNGSSQVNGFYAAGKYVNTGRSKIVSAIKVVQINTSTWDFYAFLIAYSGEAGILIFNSSEGTWTPGFSLATPSETAIFSDLSNESYHQDNSFFTENVGIGTMNTQGYRLAVGGSMIAESVKVKLQGTWPDFVFAKDYKLPSLQATEQHILANGHLPGIPSAAEVAKDGIELGEMNKKLLQKIEELTLYLISNTKQLDSAVEKIGKLEAEMKKIRTKP